MTPNFAPGATIRVSSSVLTDGLKLSALYPILDDGFETKRSLPTSVAAFARAGCRLVQLRAKTLTTRELMEWAQICVQEARRHQMTILINDRADVALLSGADGVHLGQDDLSVESARRVLGDEAIVGLSTHTLDQARLASRENVDYVAIGPVFDTRTKVGAFPAVGVEGVARVKSIVGKPLVAIGGLTLSSAPDVLGAGADGLAVISALYSEGKEGPDLERLATRWLRAGQTRTDRS